MKVGQSDFVKFPKGTRDVVSSDPNIVHVLSTVPKEEFTEVKIKCN